MSAVGPVIFRPGTAGQRRQGVLKMSFEKKYDKDQVKAKLDIWLSHRSADKFRFKSGYDTFSIMPVVEK